MSTDRTIDWTDFLRENATPSPGLAGWLVLSPLQRVALVVML